MGGAVLLLRLWNFFAFFAGLGEAYGDGLFWVGDGGSVFTALQLAFFHGLHFGFDFLAGGWGVFAGAGFAGCRSLHGCSFGRRFPGRGFGGCHGGSSWCGEMGSREAIVAHIMVKVCGENGCDRRGILGEAGRDGGLGI